MASALRPLDLSEANIVRTNLSHANLEDADFTGANCSYVDFTGANMKGAVLKGTILKGAILRGVKHLTREQIVQAVIDDDTVLPDYLLVNN